MSIDRLDALLHRFSVTAHMFHSGPLCGITEYKPRRDYGQIHLVRSGVVQIDHGARKRERVDEPSLIFYPRPLPHRFITDRKDGADLACANVSFNGGEINPLAQALPPCVVMPLKDVDGAAPVLDVLFREAFSQQCGRQHIVDRLFEVVIVLIIRTMLDRGSVSAGLLAGLSDRHISKALVAIHAQPERAWTLESLAKQAGLSRTQFAALFRERTGSTPADYLARYRISVAQAMLRKGLSLKLVTDKVGYGSTAALSRAFSSLTGHSPREWMKTIRIS